MKQTVISDKEKNDVKLQRNLQLYLHIPFCVRKCRYCDFLSAPAPEEIRQRYAGRLIEQLKHDAPGRDYTVTSIFFGGGTPSLLDAGIIGQVMETIRDCYKVSDDAEISMECNPGTVDEEKLRRYRECGINRLSLGVQSFDDEQLKRLGRIHDAAMARDCFAMARRAGFDNINLDLMSALPGQTSKDWERQLREAIRLEPEHISAYSLIIEEGTAFYADYHEDDLRRQKGEKPRDLPSEEEERCMYAMTEDVLFSAGYSPYEISNYAKPGYACEHNRGYWLRRPYLGFGTGAASLFNECRYRISDSLTHYLAGDVIREDFQELSEAEQIEETMFLGLRLREGIHLEAFRNRFGRSVEEIYPDVIAKLTGQALLEYRDGRICLTAKGIDISNYVLAMFLMDEE